MVGSRIKSGREFQTVEPATEKAHAATISIDPVARYCKKLTVAGTQLSPSVSTGGRDTLTV